MKKSTLKIVIIGHIDHGKSTLIGRLLLETGSLSRERIAEIKKISRELGKDTELAYLTDQLKEERERNITIDVSHIFFKTRKRNYIIIDTPGHIEFLKNMITGASYAQAAILVVDMREGIMEQTKRHLYIINMLGIDKVIIAFNKMDLVDYGKNEFDRVKDELLKFLEKLKIKHTFILPISAKEGVNISKKFSKQKWYDGPTLLEALDLFSIGRKIAEKPLRFPVQDVYEISGEKIIVGRLAAGSIKQRQKILFLPSFENATIKSIKIFGRCISRAQEGENVGLTLDRHLSIRRGEIIAQREKPPKPKDRFKGNLFWMSGEPLQINKSLSLHCATQEVKCIAEKIEKRINSSTLEIIEENISELKINEAAVVTFKTDKPIVIEKSFFIEELGRFTLEHDFSLQGAGTVTEP